MSDDVIDERRWTALYESLVEGETSEPPPDVLVEIVGRYGATATDRLAALRSALAAGKPEDGAAALHALRGSSAMLGAALVERLAGELEDRLTARPDGDVTPAVDQLEQACARTAAALADRLAGR